MRNNPFDAKDIIHKLFGPHLGRTQLFIHALGPTNIDAFGPLSPTYISTFIYVCKFKVHFVESRTLRFTRLEEPFARTRSHVANEIRIEHEGLSPSP
jgi:hypothetical protein